MHPNTVAPSLLFIGSLASFAMIVQQLFWFRTSRWDNQGRRANRRILAVSAVLFTVLLSTLSGILGLLASQAWRVGDYSRATLNTVGEKVVVVAFQFGREYGVSLSEISTYGFPSHSVLDVCPKYKSFS